EARPEKSGRSKVARVDSQSRLVPLDRIEPQGESRIAVGISEFNRVLGGGLVPGALVLIGGDPGIGKSTLILQAAGELAKQGAQVMHVSGEESVQQIKLRADRLNIVSGNVLLMGETDVDPFLGVADDMRPGLLVVDSIQTVMLDELGSTAGSVSQVRESTGRIMQWAKSTNVPVFIVGHVTKDGAIAGPRVLEHMVDAVLYLEG